MKKIDIKISKAQIISYEVQLTEKEPVVSATIALLTEAGKQITTYKISTYHWEKELEFKLPIEMIPDIIAIMKRLETIVVKHLNKDLLMIE